MDEEGLRRFLEEKMKSESVIVSDTMISVSGFINHMVDMKLMDNVGRIFASRFEDMTPTKVLTVEASGIPPASFTAFHLGVPMLYAKKKLPSTIGLDVYFREVRSVTRGEIIPLTISKRYLNDGDRILIVDDFLASGSTCLALIDMIAEAGAKLCGFCAIIEKSFEGGGKKLLDRGVDIFCPVRIRDLRGGVIGFEEVQG